MTSFSGKGLREPADLARTHMIESLINGRAPSTEDLLVVCAKWLQRGEYLDAGLIIRGLRLAVTQSTAESFAGVLGQLATQSRPPVIEDEKILQVRITIMWKWLRAAMAARGLGSSAALDLIAAFLRAEELIQRRIARVSSSAHDEWSDWALEVATLGQGARLPLMVRCAARLAEPSARRQRKERALAISIFRSACNTTRTRGTAKLVRRLHATADQGGIE